MVCSNCKGVGHNITMCPTSGGGNARSAVVHKNKVKRAAKGHEEALLNQLDHRKQQRKRAALARRGVS
jgi:hypothetical protein